MRSSSNGADHTCAPADYADLHRQYYSYVCALVRKRGIERSRVEDVSQEILLRFMERDFLHVFNPDLVFTFNGQRRPARFKNFLTQFVLLYVRGFRDKQTRLHDRELLICQGYTGAADDGQTEEWIDVFGPSQPSHEPDVIEDLAEQELVDFLREYISHIPPRSRFDTCDLVGLLDAVIEQIRNNGEYNVAQLRQRFGVSSTAMHTWLWNLFGHLAVALDRPAPTRRPRARRTVVPQQQPTAAQQLTAA